MNKDQAQTRISGYWDRQAAEYDLSQLQRLEDARLVQAWDKVIADALAPLEAVGKPLKVLDVGTGSGDFAAAFALRGHDVTGIDLSEEMLEQSNKKSRNQMRLRFQKGDAVAPDFPAQSFDVVTSRYLLWTLRSPSVGGRELVPTATSRRNAAGSCCVVVPGGIDSGLCFYRLCLTTAQG